MQVDMGMRGYTTDEVIRGYTREKGIRGVQQVTGVSGSTQQVTGVCRDLSPQCVK